MRDGDRGTPPPRAGGQAGVAAGHLPAAAHGTWAPISLFTLAGSGYHWSKQIRTPIDAERVLKTL